uniref:Glycosyltransferase n=1 Tax=[Ixeris] dentata var. albiflora TaxID=190261 RepID=A9X3L6_9ASTR|nr:UDP-glucosyltransferase [[Ixeris] dentata var. albiflora]
MDAVAVNSETMSHVVFIPFPAQSHIKCMLKLARLLHHKGLHITFVNTELNHNQLLSSGGPNSLDGEPGFRFKTIPDGVPEGAPDFMYALCDSVLNKMLDPFVDLIGRLESPATCIIGDGMMPFTVAAAEKLKLPIMHFWTFPAAAFLGYYQAPNLIEKGFIPPKDESWSTNGYLETVVDSISGLEGFRIRDIPAYFRTTDPNDSDFNYIIECVKAIRKVSNIVLHTFEELESTIIKALQPMIPHVYTIGPLELLLNPIKLEEETEKLDIKGYSLWKEDDECLKWLDSKEPNSVIYVNFGSLISMSKEQLAEFGWGLVNSNHCFLWVIRRDLVVGDSAPLPPELKERINERGFIASWCPQEKVLKHSSVGGFLTHCGWGSIIESLSAGVPMLCWPYLWDQPTNCRQACKEWEVGLEIEGNVNKDEVERLTRELIGGEKGKQMRSKALEWKKKIEIATGPKGSSSLNVERLANDINMFSRN